MSCQYLVVVSQKPIYTNIFPTAWVPSPSPSSMTLLPIFPLLTSNIEVAKPGPQTHSVMWPALARRLQLISGTVLQVRQWLHSVQCARVRNQTADPWEDGVPCDEIGGNRCKDIDRQIRTTEMYTFKNGINKIILWSFLFLCLHTLELLCLPDQVKLKIRFHNTVEYNTVRLFKSKVVCAIKSALVTKSAQNHALKMT